MDGLLGVESLQIPADMWSWSHETLRRIGEGGDEGLVLWVGRRDGNVFRVKSIVRPQQRAVRTESGISVIVDADELHRLGVWLHEHRVEIGAQVHSHPGAAYHSELDDEIPVATTVGAFSLVVPDFARGAAEIGTYMAYRLSATGAWEHIVPDEFTAMVEIGPAARPLSS